ncbi:MAG: radical SAM protein, partial [Ruminococcus sp.]|nr:radical SAM protein [Ruminococcus sp.]
MDNVRIDQCTVTLTRKCNLRCDFCYAKKTEYIETAIIEYDNLKKVVDFCNDARVKFIVFTGGEPTLYPRLLDILKYIKSKDNKMIPTIATNGILLEDMEYCRSLIDNGIEYIDISLKGKDNEECYEMVGRDCFLQQSKAIHNLSMLPIEFTCSIVLTSENINSLCDTVRNARDNGAKQFSFTFVIDNEKSSESDEAYLLKNNPLNLIELFISHIDKLNSITEEWWIEYSFPMCIYTRK